MNEKPSNIITLKYREKAGGDLLKHTLTGTKVGHRIEPAGQGCAVSIWANSGGSNETIIVLNPVEANIHIEA